MIEDDSEKPYSPPSRHDMFALAEQLEVESRFIAGILAERERGGYRDDEQIEPGSPAEEEKI